MADDRLEQLERRVAQLEGIVRQLSALILSAGATRAPELPGAPTASTPASTALSPPPSATSPRVVVRPRVEINPPSGLPDRVLDWEQWIGQRGLLVVGVLALLATGGFFLNYAIQHGWIAPIVRASGAVAVGVALAIWGDRLVRRGMLRYGAAIIGGGGGLVYLGIWAAAGPYALVSREIGVLLLAATSGVVVAMAVRHNVEGLAIWALAGAYLAPLFLASAEPSPAKFLAYMAVVGTSLMVLSERMSWRATFNIALFGFFLLPTALIATDLTTTLGVNYGVLGAVVALLATGTTRSPWPEARIGALAMVWMLLFATTGNDALRWTALGAGALITLIVWWQQLRATPPPLAGFTENQLSPEFIVYLTPLALVTLGVVAPPEVLAPWRGLLPLALGVVYLASGWPLKAVHLAVMGFVLLALAISGQWDGATVAAGWAVLAAVASASGRWAGCPGAIEVNAVLAPLAFLQLFSVAVAVRAPADPAFVGHWSLAWYVCLLAGAATARWWETDATRETRGGDKTGVLLWSIAVATLLLGGSLELDRALLPSTFYAATALVLYWVTFATGLVLGASFWRPALRIVALRSALLLTAAAYLLLFSVTWGARDPADPAFIGVWSAGWYVAAAAAVVAARWWPAAHRRPDPMGEGQAAFWWMAGGCVLLGGSLELHRAFTSELAGDLAISTFWLLYAAALVRAGFVLDRKVVRSAGLGVAALAAMKIVLYDLSALEALYRVASFFVLALITLAVAYAYNKRAKSAKASAV
jgi:hypothetical protein